MTHSSDTIFALASGAGRAGVAVYRLSGPLAGAAIASLCGRSLPPPRQVRRTRLWDRRGDLIDDGLVLWFPAPASFTGDDVAELHLHGGRAVATALTEALTAFGLRAAEPGEFSRRAFLNGKMDLTAAEAVADLVEAETSAQRRQALRQMEGALSRLTEAWRADLVQALAHLEAVIDFADEGIPDSLVKAVQGRLERLTLDLRSHLADGRRGERLRDGVHIAIVGAPNAGKSSLLNRLAGREAAIVSAIAGTTRDVIEVHLDLGGWPVVVADTAGLREVGEEIEAEGVRRARARADAADLKLAVFDAALLPDLDSATLAMIDESTVVVLNKVDLAAGPVPQSVAGCAVVAVSATTGAGLDLLVERVSALVGERFGQGEAPVLTRARHRSAVEDALRSLERVDLSGGIELAAEDLRLAARALGRISGRVEVEEVLDAIFREFCIGK
jgi:tRNA modification GTPase